MLKLATRLGPKPRTSVEIPHQQLSDNPPRALHEAMAARFLATTGVDIRPSKISVPGAQALFVPEGCACNSDACFVDREFAHIHPPYDGSFHLSLSASECAHVIEQGWGELHPLAVSGRIPPTVMMIFAPRNEADVEVIMQIVAASQRFAMGAAVAASA